MTETQRLSRPPSPSTPPHADAMDERYWSAVLAEYKLEYAEYLVAWKDLDTKAQGLVAAAGVLLVVVATFVRERQYEVSVVSLLAAALLLNSACSGYALKSLLLRRHPAAARAAYLRVLATDIAAGAPAESSLRWPGFLHDQLDLWADLLEGLRRAYNAKADALLGAQLFMAMAMVMLTLIVGLWLIR